MLLPSWDRRNQLSPEDQSRIYPKGEDAEKTRELQEALECSICMQKLSDPGPAPQDPFAVYALVETCGHCFHADCLHNVFSNNRQSLLKNELVCPICSKPIADVSLVNRFYALKPPEYRRDWIELAKRASLQDNAMPAQRGTKRVTWMEQRSLEGPSSEDEPPARRQALTSATDDDMPTRHAGILRRDAPRFNEDGILQTDSAVLAQHIEELYIQLERATTREERTRISILIYEAETQQMRDDYNRRRAEREYEEEQQAIRWRAATREAHAYADARFERRKAFLDMVEALPQATFVTRWIEIPNLRRINRALRDTEFRTWKDTTRFMAYIQDLSEYYAKKRTTPIWWGWIIEMKLNQNKASWKNDVDSLVSQYSAHFPAEWREDEEGLWVDTSLL